MAEGGGLVGSVRCCGNGPGGVKEGRGPRAQDGTAGKPSPQWLGKKSSVVGVYTPTPGPNGKEAKDDTNTRRGAAGGWET